MRKSKRVPDIVFHLNFHKPVWLGIAKKGNRRGRSRWNYNR